MIYYILLTAFTVSIDSFICGYTLSLLNKKKIPVILGVTLTVFVMCLLANYLTAIFSSLINEKTACLGGLLLVAIGIYNLVKNKSASEPTITNSSYIKTILISGFAVGLDGAVANLSLSIMGMNQFYVPLIIAVIHGIMISLGIFLSKAKLSKKLAKIEFLPPLMLVILGCYKLLGLFI